MNTLFKEAGAPLGNTNTIPAKDASFVHVLFRTPKVLCVRISVAVVFTNGAKTKVRR